MEDFGYSLESFVEKIELPHRAKVTEGYYEPGDEEGDREFSNGEILEVRRLICPFVDLTFRHPPNSDQDSRITISTRNQDLRFRVVTEMEALDLARPKIFRDVKDIINKWPNSIKSLSDHTVQIPGSEPGVIARGEELRLIRVIKDENSADDRLELKVNSTKQLVQLPAGFTGTFHELEDPKSYSLQELVDMARVERFLRLDLSSELDDKATQVRGLPTDFEGVLEMKKPQVLVEISRVLVRETNGEEYKGQPLLCPINCDIKLTPRDVSYMPLPFETYHLSSLGERQAKRLPFIARMVTWTEETAILQNHVTKPGDHLVVYSRTSVNKILAHCGQQYFLIPVDHRGCFKSIRKGKKKPKEVKLGSLETKTFPIVVQYFNTSEYRNTIDDHLPLTEQLILDRFVKAEPCIVVSKLFGDVIGNAFHLPLRTKITIRLERRWKKSMTVPQQMSHLDSCSEEITEAQYHEIMRTNEYQLIRAAGGTLRKERLPPAPPPRPGRPNTPLADRPNAALADQPNTPLADQPNAALADRPQPPLPPTTDLRPVKKRTDSDEDDDDDSDKENYSYIDIRCLGLTRADSATEEEINKGIVEIPVNGNISGFSVYQMVFFLRENHAPCKTLSTWRKKRIDGMAFANMTDDDLKTHGIATPVIQFFRDRSRMQIVLAHL